MDMRIKENPSLIIAILIPVLMVVFITASIYLPGMFAHPQYDFLYMTSSGSYYETEGYYVSGGQLKAREGEDTSKLKLFVYDAEQDQSRQISFEDAGKLNLDDSAVSPDGFKVDYGTKASSFLFFFYSNTDYESLRLKKEGISKKINVQTSGSSRYSSSFRFLGWVR